MERWWITIQSTFQIMSTQSAIPTSFSVPEIKRRNLISTLLFTIQATIIFLVLVGLLVMAVRLNNIQTKLSALRDGTLPRLVKLSQLSQESAASISIAPAMSTNPSRFEFETLLSRIQDKKGSQKTLIEELESLIKDDESARLLKKNSDLLSENLQTLTNVVRKQIGVRKRIEKHIENFNRMARSLTKTREHNEFNGHIAQTANANILRILCMLQDQNRARFSRNQKEITQGIKKLELLLQEQEVIAYESVKDPFKTVAEFKGYWSPKRERIYEDKKDQLANEFKIKALVEENSLIANRLLSSARTEFWRASEELSSQIHLIVATTNFIIIATGLVVFLFIAGSFFVWFILQKRVFKRLDRMRDLLGAYTENRNRSLADPLPDEIGAISSSLVHYMDVIDQREMELAKKSATMEQLSNKLAKYLSPQVYDSIFSGKQEVKVSSNRKKLTVFFSDIVDFTKTADRLESEVLTEILNHYLTEMSQIALAHGATIDKYVGDAIMIFFGDPETKGVREDTLACVKMSIQMRNRLLDLADTWRQSGIENPLRCRIGINTGYCTVGNFGSEDRLDYTIIGGTVNTASRLESLAEPGQILISYETYAMVKDEIDCDKHGEIEVKGLAYPVATYQVNECYDNLKKQNRFREESHAMKIDLNLDAMTSEEQSHATKILKRALAKLESGGS